MCAERFERKKWQIVAYLPNCKVEGWINLPHGCKSLSDFVTLNPAKKFITVIDATVSAIQGEYGVKKLNINKDYIVTIFSKEG